MAGAHMTEGEALDGATLRFGAFDSLDEIGGRNWNNLLERSATKTVFQTSEWFSSWKQTYGKSADVLIPFAYLGDRLVAACAFINANGMFSFAAADRADYLDLLLDQQINPELQLECLQGILGQVRSSCREFKYLKLDRVPADSTTIELLMQLSPEFYAVCTDRIPAPRMSMEVVADRVNKKSLKRHAKGLGRLGCVEFNTYTRPEDVLPRLNAFFQLHVERWASTEYPSLFLNAENRAFYVELTRRLATTGMLRYSELNLDTKLIAAHYGFFSSARFIWYKPAFDVSLAKHSPGEVLLRNLLLLAKDEAAEVFDFTIGGEAFKYRFATDDPTVSCYYITGSRVKAGVKSTIASVRKMLR